MKWRIFWKTIEMLIEWFIIAIAFIIACISLAVVGVEAQVALLDVPFEWFERACMAGILIVVVCAAIRFAWDEARKQVYLDLKK